MPRMESVYFSLFLFSSMFFFGICHYCEYCKGKSCIEEEIPLISCDNQPTGSLPYGFNITFEESTEVCLDLKYKEEENIYLTKQCFKLSESYDLCEEIRLALPTNIQLEKCKIDINEGENVTSIKRDTVTDAPSNEAGISTSVASTEYITSVIITSTTVKAENHTTKTTSNLLSSQLAKTSIKPTVSSPSVTTFPSNPPVTLPTSPHQLGKPPGGYSSVITATSIILSASLAISMSL